MRSSYDFVVIGGGSAGYNAARIAADNGMRVAVIDGAPQLGGLCILRGCMPSKTLIYSAEILHLAQNARGFGLSVLSAKADMRALHARKRRIISGFARHRARQLEDGKFDLIRGTAQFVDAHTVKVGHRRKITARRFLIATGSKVCVPEIPGLADVPHWTSDDVLELNFKPKSVIVLGGGTVACELVQFLGRVGSRVCVIQRSPHLLRSHPPQAAKVLARAFGDEGIEVITDTQITGIQYRRGRFSVRFRRKGKSLVRTADHLLNALGRQPATSRLSLPAAGVKTADNGRIRTNRWQQTTSPNIYAAGDCCGPHEIVHVAIQQGELAARHAAKLKGLKPISDALLLSIIFTDPQVGTIGWSERKLKEKGVEYVCASYPFNDHGKSILMNADYGYVKVFAAREGGRILGAEIVGKEAGELIHCFTVPLSMRATVHDMLKAPWYHPTLSEIITYPLEELAQKVTIRGKRIPRSRARSGH